MGYIIMNDKTRMVTLHKHITESDNTVWRVELDGVDTYVGLTQELMDDISSAQRCNMLDEIVNGIAQHLAENDYPITDNEKDHLNKLLQCMT